MKGKLLLFGGTEEGRRLAELLADRGWHVTLWVATRYGRELAQPRPGLAVQAGRLEEWKMEAMLAREPWRCVVDATHPYATQVTENLRRAARAAQVPYLRLLRPSTARELPGQTSVAGVAEAVAWLSGRQETALLTTGSKDLEAFARVPDFQRRLYVRVLPSLDSLSHALDLGYPARHVICMQGPFSAELNAAALRQVGASVLVTKDTGTVGGFEEKAAGAAQAGARLLVIRRPSQEEGLDWDQLLDAVRALEEETP